MKNLFLIGEIGWEVDIDYLKNNIDLNSNEDMRIFIDSPGGFVFDAFLMFDFLKLYKGKIEFVIMSFAGSAAGYLIFAGQTVSCFKNSNWMTHHVKTPVYGNSEKLRSVAYFQDKLEATIINTFIDKTNFTDKDFKNKKLPEELWLIGGEELLKNGIVSKVYDNIADMQIEGERINDFDQFMKKDLMEIENKSHIRFETTNKKVQEKSIDGDQILKMAAVFEQKSKKTLDKPSNVNETNAQNSNMELSMKLSEMLLKDPELQKDVDEFAENFYKNKIKDNPVDSEKIKNAVEAERVRIAKILKYENTQLTDVGFNAIENGQTIEQYADSKLLGENEKRLKRKQTFGDLKTPQTPGDQDPENKDESEEDFEKDTEKALNKRFQKDGK